MILAIYNIHTYLFIYLFYYIYLCIYIIGAGLPYLRALTNTQVVGAEISL